VYINDNQDVTQQVHSINLIALEVQINLIALEVQIAVDIPRDQSITDYKLKKKNYIG